MDIYAEFINYLDPVEDLTVTLTSPSSTLTILGTHDEYYVGDLGMMETSGTCLAPFKAVISSFASANSRVYLKFNYNGTDYDDQEYFEKRIHPPYIDLHKNLVETSMDSRGNFGFTDFPQSPKGRGFNYDGNLNYLGEGGFLIGTSSTQVSDVIRNSSATQDNDFQAIQPAYLLEPGPFGDQEGTCLFSG